MREIKKEGDGREMDLDNKLIRNVKRIAFDIISESRRFGFGATVVPAPVPGPVPVRGRCRYRVCASQATAKQRPLLTLNRTYLPDTPKLTAQGQLDT